MLLLRKSLCVAIGLGALAVSCPAHADQVLQPGISVRARNIDFDGTSVLLSGSVLIAATPDHHIILKSQKNGLQVKFSDNQDRLVMISPFDVKSETVALNPDGMTLTDGKGNSVTILTTGKLPELPPAAVTTVPAPVAAAPATPPVSVTIVQTPPPADEPPHKKERYHDPVTDRGAVIP